MSAHCTTNATSTEDNPAVAELAGLLAGSAAWLPEHPASTAPATHASANLRIKAMKRDASRRVESLAMSTWVAQVDKRIRSDIAKFGVHIIGSETDDGLPWLHTIGMRAIDLPEMVMTGLDVAPAHAVLNALAKSCLALPDDPITPGREFVDDYNRGLTWKAARVSAQWCRAHMNKMNRFYPGRWRPGDPACVVQVLWPDEHGNHPGPLWAPDFQPLLEHWPAALAAKPPARAVGGPGTA